MYTERIDWRHVEYGGFWRRFFAMLIDSFILAIMGIPFLAIIIPLSFFDFGLISMPLGFFSFTILPAIIVILFWLGAQATPGKMLFGLRILDEKTGEPASLPNYLIRYITYYLSGLFLGLGYIWAGFHPRKQAWHDLLAGTVVVQKDSLWRTERGSYARY